MTNTMTGGRRSPLVIGSPQDAIAAVPYLLGFHPETSLVAIGTNGPNGTCVLRLDLPTAGGSPPAGSEPAGIGRRVAELLAHNDFCRCVLLGYGTDEQVRAVVEQARDALDEHGVDVPEALRVHEGRWWSYLCDGCGSCSAGGTPFDIKATVVAAQATLDGQVVLPSRSDLARTVAPSDDPADRESMRGAARRAHERIVGWAADGMGPQQLRAKMLEHGVPLIERLYAAAVAGAPPPGDDEIAWLAVLLSDLRVRDEAWVRIDDDRLEVFIGFWRAVLRRVAEPYAAAPACLLAYAALGAGEGGLANVALDRAAASDPDYSLARLLRDVLQAGIPPAKTRLSMTPDDVAAAYADQEGGMNAGPAGG